MRSKHGWQRWMATAVVVSALAAPGALASPIGGPGASPSLKAYEAERASQDARAASQPDQVSRSPVAADSSGGFQWSDAGIGAVAMLGAISLCGALYLLSGRRRERHLPRAIG